MKNEHEYLLIWADQKGNVVKAPFKPYFYSLKELAIPGAVVSKVEAIAISDYETKIFYKYSFNTRKELSLSRSQSTFESNIPYVMRNRIDNPDFFTKWPQTKDLVFNFLDIEQSCKKDSIFPTYSDYLLSISWSKNDREIKTVYLDKDVKTDSDLLKVYRDHYVGKVRIDYRTSETSPIDSPEYWQALKLTSKKGKPDVEVGYNKEYDIPTILKRCDRNRMSTMWMSKTKRPPHVWRRVPVMDGIIIYDILDSTKADQTLVGNVPDRKLKTVSDYFGFEGKQPLDRSNITSYQGTKELVEYSKADVMRLFLLFDIYWPGIQYLAEDLKIPLNEATNLNVFNLGLVVLGDLYRENGIICDGDNAHRYPEIFHRPGKKPGDSNYQGAINEIYRYGYFEPVHKVDFSGMYPRIVSLFNLSPDTCRLIRYDEYDESGFRIVEKKNRFIYHIPDDVLDKTVVISVLKKQGFLAAALNKFLEERVKYKKEYKKTESLVAKTKSWWSKLKANGICGVLGNPHHPFGFVLIIIVMCGIGRECAKLLIEILERLYPGSAIESDTDGVYCSVDNFDENLVQKEFKKAIVEKFGRELDLEIDIDEYDAGWFYLAKNYVLKKGKSIILHGVALKSSGKAPVERHLVDDLASAVLNKQPVEPIVGQYQKLTEVPLADLSMHVTMGMSPYKYKNKTCTVMQLADQAKKEFGVVPREGNEYYYVKVRSGYRLFESAVRNLNIGQEIDFAYYQKRMKKIVDIFTKCKEEAKNAKLF